MSRDDRIAEVLSAIRKASPSAEGERAWGLLRAYLLELVRDKIRPKLQSKIDESDIVQQSLLEARQDVSRLTGQSTAEVKVWLKRLVEHNLIDAHRRYCEAASRDVNREGSLSSFGADDVVDQQAQTASSIIARKELDIDMICAVAKLPEDQRRLLEYRHKDGWSFARIGREFGISEQAARKRWHGIVERLRKELTGNGGKRS